MSYSRIKRLNANQLFNLQANITKELIKKVQREYDESIYPIKTPSDKLECKICGGRYTRSDKSRHDRGKKHLNKVAEIFDTVSDLFSTDSE